MKNIIQATALLASLCLLLACNKGENPSPDPGEIDQLSGISVEELTSYAGDLGLRIDTRSLAKLGYLPAKVAVDLATSEGDYDDVLDIDPMLQIAQLSIPIEDLSEAAEAELRNGVGINLSIRDANDQEITTESISIASLQENAREIVVKNAALPCLTCDVDLKAGMPHFIQVVDANGNYASNVINKNGQHGASNSLLYEASSSFDDNLLEYQNYFHKIPNEENTYLIYNRQTKRYLAIDDNDNTLRQSGAFSYPDNIDASGNYNGHPRYKFIIQREDNGLYTIRRYTTGVPIKREFNGTLHYWRAVVSGQTQYFRFIALNVEWNLEELNTRYLPPVFPAVNTSFGFNSTLVNCGSGSLEQEVGVQQEITTTYTSSFSETIGLSGRLTVGASVTVGAEAEASFFGNGGKVTGDVSASVEVSVEASTSSTNTQSYEQSITNTYFSKRTVTVPPGKASLVYDAYQTYRNVYQPFVKRFRLRGTQTDGDTEDLSGAEIATQLRLTGFTGTITFIGPDYVEISIAGGTVMDNIVETQSEVRDVAADCD
ncbi:MAG: hypothetical protein AAF206_11940 [Bacteroidota bacterium]